MTSITTVNIIEPEFQFASGGQVLFTIKPDGTIVRGSAFTTVDEMSLRFWEAVEEAHRPLSK